jgi:hypothetical protein
MRNAGGRRQPIPKNLRQALEGDTKRRTEADEVGDFFASFQLADVNWRGTKTAQANVLSSFPRPAWE